MDYETWLPQNSIFDGAIVKHLNACVVLWAEKWFEKSPNFNCTFAATYKNDLKDGHYWQTEDKLVNAGLSSLGRTVLAERILGIDIPETPILDADSRLLTALVSECFTDLIEELICKFEVDEKMESVNVLPEICHDYGVLVVKDDADNVVANVNIALSSMYGFRKNNLIDMAISFQDGQRESAIEQQDVALGAYVGASQISLGDLEALTLGDVIVLDENIDGSVGLTINNQIAPKIECSIIQSDDQLSLKITKFNIED